MTKKHVDKTPIKRQAWISRTMEVFGISETEAIRLLSTPRQQSIRINPLRGDAKATLKELKDLGWKGESVAWCPNGYTITSDKQVVRDSEAVAEGRVFIQNAASWLPIVFLDPQPSETILDVCAAPGGKTSHIAAVTANGAHIWANDNSRARLAKLQANLERLDANVENYTLYDATMLARKLSNEQFDRILLDAPCSGEGMMSLENPKDFSSWSVAQIKRLQQLQKRVITQAWQLLKPGGTLVYSTCTMAPEEDEAVIDYLLRSTDDATIIPIDLKLPNRVATVKEWNGKMFAPATEGAMRLKPSLEIEAFFVCKLQKVGVTE
jgi:16S rRNA (cytosine1407-C5)-methyltransferase